METRERLERHARTARQRAFEWDFTKGWQDYEFWDEVVVGTSAQAQNTFRVEVEDILDFNRSCLEDGPAYTDPDDPVPHPLFVVQVAFYCIGTGIGSWIRTPGARNPGQDIELHERLRPGEVVTATVTHHDKWIRRDKHYLQDLVELRNQEGVLKARWYVQLILPPDRDAVARFADA